MKPRWLNRRLIARACIFLLLGAIINVAVAWGLVFSIREVGDPTDHTEAIIAFDDEGWVAHFWALDRYTEFGLELFDCVWMNKTINRAYFDGKPDPSSVLPSWGDLGPPSEEFVSSGIERRDRMVAAWGWPFQSLYCVADLDVGAESITHYKYALRAGDIGDNPSQPRLLPLRPIPHRFALNAIISASALLTCATLVNVVKRALRLRRGHCPHCNYDLQGNTSGICPECGHD